MAKTVFQALMQVPSVFLNKIFSHRHDGINADGSAPIDYAADTGGADAYVIALDPPLIAHVVGMPINFKAANNNTGASTFNPNALGAKAIKKRGMDIAADDIRANQIYTVVYDGAAYQLISLPGSGSEFAGKNALLNGDGVIAQRAMGAAVNDDVYTFDRWIVLSDGNGVVTPSQEAADLPSGARAAMKLTVAVANKKFRLTANS